MYSRKEEKLIRNLLIIDSIMNTTFDERTKAKDLKNKESLVVC